MTGTSFGQNKQFREMKCHRFKKGSYFYYRSPRSVLTTSEGPSGYTGKGFSSANGKWHLAAPGSTSVFGTMFPLHRQRPLGVRHSPQRKDYRLLSEPQAPTAAPSSVLSHPSLFPLCPAFSPWLLGVQASAYYLLSTRLGTLPRSHRRCRNPPGSGQLAREPDSRAGARRGSPGTSRPGSVGPGKPPTPRRHRRARSCDGPGQPAAWILCGCCLCLGQVRRSDHKYLCYRYIQLHQSACRW